ncbi:hypothetical protein B0T14DRAFT_40604 [Immersiella caudata]|uniref:Uncharacterized protein n=1 Tax=Immersiella caudata TaxID=314043 RepID=A0AA39XG43_9PEZI|nr:hypothetical protein B0T14DRAFT_40604 [Immersiella caudata]
MYPSRADQPTPKDVTGHTVSPAGGGLFGHRKPASQKRSCRLGGAIPQLQRKNYHRRRTSASVSLLLSTATQGSPHPLRIVNPPPPGNLRSGLPGPLAQYFTLIITLTPPSRAANLPRRNTTLLQREQICQGWVPDKPPTLRVQHTKLMPAQAKEASSLLRFSSHSAGAEPVACPIDEFSPFCIGLLCSLQPQRCFCQLFNSASHSLTLLRGCGRGQSHNARRPKNFLDIHLAHVCVAVHSSFNSSPEIFWFVRAYAALHAQYNAVPDSHGDSARLQGHQ